MFGIEKIKEEMKSLNLLQIEQGEDIAHLLSRINRVIEAISEMNDNLVHLIDRFDHIASIEKKSAPKKRAKKTKPK